MDKIVGRAELKLAGAVKVFGYDFRGKVVKNERIRREIIKRFEQWLARNGFVVVKKRDNDVVGKVGKNQERFYWLRLA